VSRHGGEVVIRSGGDNRGLIEALYEVRAGLIGGAAALERLREAARGASE
jgi:hypothetical protein